jgi:hypothetical protein
MQIAITRRPSPTKIGVKWLLLSLAFVWLVGCVGLGKKTKAARDPFADHKFSCGEEMPNGKTSANLDRKRG